MFFTAKSYAVMTESVPTAGSVYGFARHALGVLPGFIAGWMILLDYLLIPSFVYVTIAVAFGTLVPGLDRAFWIVLLVGFTTAVNWFGVTVTTRANFIAVILQLIVLIGFAGLAMAAVGHGFGNGAMTLRPFLFLRPRRGGRDLFRDLAVHHVIPRLRRDIDTVRGGQGS